MPDASTSPAVTHDRRLHARRQTNSLAYVDLGEDNGGLVLNMSEGGIAVHAAVMMSGDHLPKIRFQLPQSQDWIEAAGQVTWTGDSRKNAGIEFVGLAEESRERIRGWLTSTEPAYQPPAVRRQSVDAHKLAALASLPVEATPARVQPQEPSVTQSATTSVITATGNGTAQPATASFVRPAATEVASPVVGPALVDSAPDRPRRWPLNPALTVGGRPAELPGKPRAAMPRWPVVASATTFLVAASFLLGLTTGRGAWTGILAGAREMFAGKSVPATASEAPQPAAAVTGGNSASQPNSSAPPNAPGNALQAGAVGSAERAARIPSPNNSVAQNAMAHRAAPPQNTNAATAEDSSSMLSTPDTPLAASSSVAVSSRLYILVPTAPALPGSPQHTGNVQIGRLISRAEIVYPPDAEAQRVEGIVKLHVTIGADGAVSNATPISGPSALAAAALDAVRQWRYKPTVMDGHAIETEADITAVFRLPQVSQ
jgi:protein TonB